MVTDANRLFLKKLVKAAEREDVYRDGPFGDAVAEWTRERMYRRLHVPLRYILPGADPAAFNALAAELMTPDNCRRWDFPPSADVRRGFVSAAALPDGDVCAGLRSLCALHPLERVSLVRDGSQHTPYTPIALRDPFPVRVLDTATLRYAETSLCSPWRGGLRGLDRFDDFVRLLEARAPYLRARRSEGYLLAAYPSPGEFAQAVGVALADWGRRLTGLPDAFVPRLVQKSVGIADARPGQAGFAGPACLFRHGGRVWCRSGTAFYRMDPWDPEEGETAMGKFALERTPAGVRVLDWRGWPAPEEICYHPPALDLPVENPEAAASPLGGGRRRGRG